MNGLIWGLVCGLLIGIAITLQSAGTIRQRRDAQLKARNEYLETEVSRLRAQVALHINPEADPKGRSSPALKFAVQ